jgi:hypothetical protein
MKNKVAPQAIKKASCLGKKYLGRALVVAKNNFLTVYFAESAQLGTLSSLARPMMSPNVVNIKK